MRMGQAKLRTRTKDVPTFLGLRNGPCVSADLFCHISTYVCSFKSGTTTNALHACMLVEL